MATEQDTPELIERIEGILRGPDIEKAAEKRLDAWCFHPASTPTPSKMAMLK